MHVQLLLLPRVTAVWPPLLLGYFAVHVACFFEKELIPFHNTPL